ncbi:MAG: ATP-binding protein [Myxococcota bacterium]
MKPNEKYRLAPDKLAKICDPALFRNSKGREVSSKTRFIGQDRAIEAIEFGLEMKEPGYNIYVAGLPGLGKGTIVSAFLDRVAKKLPPPPDWCYVYNFDQPDAPTAISLPTGNGVVFASDIDELIKSIRNNIKKVFASQEFKERRTNLLEQLENERRNILEKVNRKIKKYGLALRVTEHGILSFPAIDGEVIPFEKLKDLSPDQREKMLETNKLARPELERAFVEFQKLERKSNTKFSRLLRDTTENIVKPLVDEMRKKYAQNPDVLKYLKKVQEHILNNAQDLFPEANPRPPSEEQLSPETVEDEFSRYSVNVFIDNSQTQGAPVIKETNPSYYNLFGRVEYRAIMGTLVTDFSMIKPGALHRANGGFLVIHASDLFRRGFSYDALKRCLRNREIRIEDPRETLDLTTTEQLRPQPIPLNLKVILVGSQAVYYLIRYYDEEFRKLFKVKAEFDTEIKRDKSSILMYHDFIRFICEKEQLPSFTAAAAAAVVDYAGRLADSQEKLSTKFSELGDIIREAACCVKKDRGKMVKPEDIEKAVKNRHRRFNLFEEKIKEYLYDGTVLIKISGKDVGQINGLAVYDLDDISFGKPTRITAAVSLGRAGVIDIERESNMGGNIHTKGVLILKNYLADKFARNFPLSISASLCFEQSYGGIDGDSASAAELFALLSAISNTPLDQGIAVTGSVNQKGKIQAIGGVNEKIEGYYDICKKLGFTGRQGVIIPRSNVKNLMLPADIREAVKRGKFHIWAIESVEEGVEILTGLAAGKRGRDGKYPPQSLFGKVERALYNNAIILQEFGKEKKKSDNRPKRNGE